MSAPPTIRMLRQHRLAPMGLCRSALEDHPDDLEAALARLDELLVHHVCIETAATVDFAQQCLQRTNWDLDSACDRVRRLAGEPTNPVAPDRSPEERLDDVCSILDQRDAATLTSSQRAILLAREFIAQSDNGGMPQALSNLGGEVVRELEGALGLIGSSLHQGIVAQALELAGRPEQAPPTAPAEAWIAELERRIRTSGDELALAALEVSRGWQSRPGVWPPESVTVALRGLDGRVRTEELVAECVRFIERGPSPFLALPSALEG